MSLVKCPECGKDVSNSARTCPHCGYGLRRSKGGAKVLTAIVVGILVAGGIVAAVLLLPKSGETPVRPRSPAPFYEAWPFDAEEARRCHEETARRLGVPRETTADLGNGVSMKFVLIPAGTFQMGSPASEAHRESEETQHTVKLTKAFYMGTTEVTQEQYESVMGSNPSWFKGAKNPVEKVSWNEATEFCKKMSQKTGKAIRLPTEAEWEYACRAGSTTPFHFGNTISTDQANYDGNYTYGGGSKWVYREKTMPVGSFPANAWGLYDMHGNVWEWCQDGYGEYPSGTVTDPTGLASSGSRVLRGGSWGSRPWYCRSAGRARTDPDSLLDNFGFRVVVSSSAGLD